MADIKHVCALVPREFPEYKDSLVLDDRIFPKEQAEIIAPAVDAVLANEDLYNRYAKALKELIETDQKIESNRRDFESLLQKEVIEKVRLSGYEVMQGKCDQCPKEI